jgi:hypothetical protein
MKTAVNNRNSITTDQAKTTPSSDNAGGPQAGRVEPATSPTTTRDGQAAPSSLVVVTSFVVLGAHLTWMLYGPFILFLILVKIVSVGTGWLTTLDATYFIVVAAMIAGRWIDQRSGQAAKSTGERSTWEDFRRYALLLPPLAIGAWILANLLGNHWLQGGAGL